MSVETGTWSKLADLIRLSNQSGTLLLMLPSLWALMLASQGRPTLTLVVIFAAGAFLMRSAGVIVNDLADRSLDRQVERTRNRPLASGALGVREAVMAAAALIALAASLLLFLNRLTFLLSPVAILLTALYPFSKRFIHIPQVMLGIAFGWGAVMAWAAVRNSLDPAAWLLYAATVCWALAYDTIYALQDRADDLRIGVKSAAILFGSRVWLAVGASLVGMLIFLALAGRQMAAGVGYYGMLAAVGGFFSQQVWRLRTEVPPDLAFTMFKQHVWVGVAILVGLWVGFL